MAAPAVLPHRDAVLAALTAAVATFDGKAPTSPTSEYAVLYFGAGTSERESLADARTDFQALFQVTCVGATPERALWVADKVRGALHGKLVVAGREAWRPEELGGPEMQRDDDTNPPVFFLPVQYRLMSTA